MAEQIKVELIAEVKKARGSINELGLQVEDLKDEIKNFGKESEKTTKKTSKGFAALKKGVGAVGGALKGLMVGGLALIVAGFATLLEGLRNNQAVMDGLAVVMKTVQGVAAQVASVFVDMFKKVSELTGGFDALQKVIGGAFTISINLVIGAVQGLILGVKNAQLAWETSFFGKKDPDTIIKLGNEIEALELKLTKTGENLSNAGKQISDNFGEAVNEVGQLAKGISEATQKAIEEVDVEAAKSRAKRIVELENEAKIAIAENDKLQFQYQRDAELQRQIRDDVSKSLEDRTKANDELLNVLKEQEKLQKANAQIQINLATERLAVDKNNIDNKVALIEAEKNYADVLENITGFMSEQDVNRVGLQIEELDLIKSQTEAQNARMITQREFAAEQEMDSLKRLDMLIESANLENKIETERLQANIDNYEKGTQARIDAEQAYSDFKVQNDQKIEQLEKQSSEEKIKLDDDVLNAKFDTAKQALSLIGDIAGEGSKIAKAAAIGQATVAGVQSTIEAYKTAAASPITTVFPAYPVIQAALAAGFAATNISKIKSTNMSGGGGSIAAAVPSAPPAFNVVGSSPVNQLAETIGGESQKPIKAFVTSGDVTTAQSLDRNIIENASIG